MGRDYPGMWNWGAGNRSSNSPRRFDGGSYAILDRLTGAPVWVLTSGNTPATLDIDFVNDQAWNSPSTTTIASLLTCTRASTGYYTKADGTLTSFGNNVLRYGTNGLLVEEARTNVCIRSQELGTSWTASGVSVSSDTNAAPDGTTTADTLTENTANSRHIIFSSSGVVSSGVTTAISVYAKAGTCSFAAVICVASANNYFSAVFDLSASSNTSASQTSTGSSSGTIALTKQEALANGWYRLTIVGSLTGSGFIELGTAAAASGNTLTTSGEPTFVGTSRTLILWGAQAEAGSFATSYIPTTSASATRAADVVSFARPASLSGTIESVYAQFNITNTGVFAAGVGGSSAWAYIDAGTTKGANYNGSLLTTANTYTGGTTGKIASGWDGASRSVCLNGGTVATVGNTFLASATYYIGSYSTGSSLFSNGYIKRSTWWKSRLADAALQTLTT